MQIHLRIKFREEPTAAEGTGSCRGREGEGRGGTPIGGSMVPLPGFRASGSLEMLLLRDAPNVAGLRVSTCEGGGCATSLSPEVAALDFFQLLQGAMQISPQKG